MHRICGLETEYGITVAGVEDFDAVAESIQLVAAYAHIERALPSVARKWNYALEDPHLDARGFRVKELANEQEELSGTVQNGSRGLLLHELRSDLVLSNGARFYNDHAHPEYSTPECLGLLDLVAHDKAGEVILAQCAQWRNAQIKHGRVKLYKNNTDFHGHSYGCHDNYLMARSVPFDYIVAGITPFLVTRQIFAGAGKVGAEGEPGAQVDYQISQRADFLTTTVGIDTMSNRPLVNTRDEPHADPARYRRLHIIAGDANMSEMATALKIGTTALVIDLMELGVCPSDIKLPDPVAAVRAVSRDLALKTALVTDNGKLVTAIDIQRQYLAAAEKHLRKRDDETDWVLQRWREVLEQLARNPAGCANWLDWVAKKCLLETFREVEGLAWDDPWLKSLDLEYHNLSPTEGLYFALLEQGRLDKLVAAEAVSHAVRHPPTNTRAYFRGRCVERFATELASVQWDEIAFSGDSGRRLVIDLRGVFDEKELSRYKRAVDKAVDAGDLFRSLSQRQTRL